MPHLGGDRQRGHRLPVAREGEGHRLRGHVVVPEIVVDHLERPRRLSRRGMECHDRVGVEVLSEPVAAVEVGRRASHGHEDETKPGVGRHHAPGIGRADPAGNGVPPPALRPGPRVVRADDTARRVGAVVVTDGRAHDHQVSDDERWGGDLVLSGESRRIDQVAREIHRPAVTEAGARLPGRGVEREQSRVHGAEVDALSAGRARLGSGVAPGRHAAIGEVAVVAGKVDVSIVGPALSAACRVEGRDPTERRRDVEDAVDQERRGLEPPARAQQVAGAIDPREAETGDAGGVDLGER